MTPLTPRSQDNLTRLRRASFLKFLVTLLLVPGLTFWTPVYSNPSGGVVVHGDVSMSGGAGALTITQNSQNAIINWADFSINAGELTRFVQPGSSAAALNRVTGGSASAIHGALEANGNVFLINPNGILVGPQGSIDVHGLVLSTLDVKNGEFLARSDMVFHGDSDAGVVNFGRINAIGGDVFLMGRTVSNHGTVTASSGTVGLAAGSEILLTADEGARGERLMVRAGSGSGGTGVLNDGTIEGAAVELKAHGNVYALAINNKGSVRATGVSQSGGRVFLRAPGGSVRNSGSLLASAPGAGNAAGAARVLIEAAYARVDGQIRAEGGGEVRIAASERVEVGGSVDVSSASGSGGELIVEGREVALLGGASFDASGTSGGGSMRVGGGYQGRDAEVANAEFLTVESDALLRADATVSGRGGSVVLWSDGDTLFEGEVSVEGIDGGGFVEVSGRERLGFHGIVSTRSADGSAGVLLLDPTDGRVSSSSHNPNPGDGPFNINSASLEGALGSSHVILSTPSAGDDPGNFNFESAVLWDSEFSLTTLAHGDITFTASVMNAGTGDLNFVAGWDGSTGLPATSPMETSGAFVIDDFLADLGSFGNDGRGVRLGTGSQGAAVSVGSRLGTTSVLGDHLALVGGSANDRQVQLGYRPGTASPATAASGDIWVGVLDGVSLNGGSGSRSYAQIGHGGRSSEGEKEGAITVLAGGDVSVVAGQGSGGTDRFAQIGHGGVDSSGDASGAVTVESLGAVSLVGGNTANAGAMIGHGGYLARGEHSGVIRVTAVGSVTGTSGNHNRTGVMIGHGGVEASTGSGQGNRDDILVRSNTGDIIFTPGASTPGIDSAAQIGHGGYLNAGDHSGDIRVIAPEGSIEFRWPAASSTPGPRSYAQIGHGGHGAVGSHSGEIQALAGQDVLFQSITHGTAARTHNYVQLGHGGFDAAGDHSGDITVLAHAGNIEFRFGTRGGGDRYAQLGHGGSGAAGTHTGDIAVLAGDRITFSGLSGSHQTIGSYAQLGHGGLGADSPVGHGGRIAVASRVGQITFTGGGSTSERSYSQLGHGGFDAAGSHYGDIVVRGGNNVLFTGGGSTGAGFGNYAQLGHGGMKEEGSDDPASELRGSITATARIAGSFDDIGDFYGADGSLGPDGTFDVIDITTGTSGTGLRFLGGSNVEASGNYAQLGHGGLNHHGSHGGVDDFIFVHARRTVNFTGNAGDRAYSQLGHGGHGAVSGSGHAAAITVLAGDENEDSAHIYAEGGAGEESYAQIGHGGYGALGSHSGAIYATANNNVRFRSTVSEGATSGQYAQLGHGGIGAEGDHSGDITVRAERGSLQFRGGTLGGADRYAQIGHGGTNAHGTHSGNIAVLAQTSITFSGRSISQTAERGYMQLGHGGHGAFSPSGHHGSIGAATVTGTIVFQGGGDESLESYAQLGHGGFDATGSHRGDIVVRSGNSFYFDGGTGAGSRNYAQLGHGGMLSSASAGSAGDLSGSIIATSRVAGVFDDIGDFYDDDGNPGQNGAFDPIAITGGTSNTGLRFRGGTNAGGEDNYSRLGHGGTNFNGDHGGADEEIFVQARRNILFQGGAAERSYVQIGHGGHGAAAGSGHQGKVTVIAGDENEELVDFTFSSGVGEDSYAQIGHGGTGALGAHSGDLYVSSNRNATFTATASTTAASGQYVQIGHGGVGAGGAHSGAVSLRAGAAGATGLISFTAGNAAASNPGGENRYAQVGHGGFATGGGHSGDIQVLAPGRIRFRGGRLDGAYAQIGHGGLNGYGAPDGTGGGNWGDIRVGSTAGDIEFAWSSTSTGSGGTPGLGSYAHLGHGGRGTTGSNEGDIFVRAGGSLLFRGPRGNSPFNHWGTYVQLGHGGFEAEGDHSGNVSVSAGIEGAFGGFFDLNRDGTLDEVEFTSDGEGGITFLSGSGSSTPNAEHRYAMLGHGGSFARGDHGLIDSEDGSALETIRVEALGDIEFRSQGNSRNYVQLGSGGFEAHRESGPRGVAVNIDVNSRLGSILFTGSTGNSAYAQLGNGGWGNLGDHRGEITVEAGRDVIFTPTTSLSSAGSNAYAQLGHGGRLAAGNHSGDIYVKAGTAHAEGEVIFAAGRGNDRYAQLGHGGRLAAGSHSGSITVESAAGVHFEGGDLRTQPERPSRLAGEAALEGNGASGRLSVSSSTSTTGSLASHLVPGSVELDILNPAASEFDLIVDDGLGNLLDGNGDVVGSINYANSTVTFFVAVSEPGIDAGQTLRASFQEFNFARAYAQLGHGGRDTTGAGHSGDITVNAGLGGVEGDVVFRAGMGTENYAQLGHGGRTAGGAHSGTIAVNAPGDILVLGGRGSASRQYAYAQIGHGTWHSGSSDISGSIDVHAGGVVELLTGAGRDAVAVIGHGGRNATGDIDGDITVSAGSDLVVSGGQTVPDGLGGQGGGADSYAQIGHHGRRAAAADSIFIGAVSVTSGGSVELIGGTRDTSHAVIGHGGRNNQGTRIGEITVEAVGDITGASGSGIRGYTQIGHTSRVTTGSVAGNMEGDVSVRSTAGAITFSGGSGTETWAHIGHGGRQSSGDHLGDVRVAAEGDISFLAGSGSTAYAGAGHLALVLNGNVVGDVSVASRNGGIVLQSGNGNDTFSQIGHGGHASTGAFSGDVQVVSATDLSIDGGSLLRSHSLVGHGGIVNNGNPTAGTREGDILVLVAGHTSVADNSSVARIGHHGTGGVVGDSRLALVTGTLDTSGSSTGVADMIAMMGNTGSVEIGVTHGDLIVDGAAAANFNGAYHTGLFASGDLVFQQSVQNAGSGSVSVVAGWDGSTGLVEDIDLGASPLINALSLEIDDVLANAASHSDGDATVLLDAEAAEVDLRVGSREGDLTVLADRIELVGGSGAEEAAQLGFFTEGSGAASGGFLLGIGAGGLSLQGGDQVGTYAQVGHGGFGAVGAALSGDIILDFHALGDVEVLGGGTNHAYAQIGHGGNGFVGVLSGDILSAGANIGALEVLGGSGIEASARIGHGGHLSNGAKSGEIGLLADAVVVRGGSAIGTGAQIGHGGRSGSGGVSGGVSVTAASGSVTLAGGSGFFSGGQIGHGGHGYQAGSGELSGRVTVGADGSIGLVGGSAQQSGAQIGHGGHNAQGAKSGDVSAVAGGDVNVLGGAGALSYAQIGHGGASADGSASGGIEIDSEGDIALASFNLDELAYAKIGHGDDLRGVFAMLSGSGTRDGDITVGAGGSIGLMASSIGHANDETLATVLGGSTQIGVSREDPTDPDGGNLIVDDESRILGEGELRFYLPGRENNQIAAGALLNGELYDGGPEAWEDQRFDEFTINLVDAAGSFTVPDEHGNIFGTPPSPAAVGGFAFYFDTITIGDLPPVEESGLGEGSDLGEEGSDFADLVDTQVIELDAFVPEDRITDDWDREHGGEFQSFATFGIYYEGFDQYGEEGESVFDLDGSNDVDSIDPTFSMSEEDLLRRQLEILGEIGEVPDTRPVAAGVGEEGEDEEESEEAQSDVNLAAGDEE